MRRRHTARRRGLLVLLVLASACLTGCEEDLASRDHFEEPFSLYGVLSPDLDTQSVRLYALEDFPSLGSAAPLAVAFTSTDLSTGGVETWQDSVLVEANGQQEHVFWAPFRAEYGHRYRVEVCRHADGAASRVDVQIPAPVTVRLPDPDAAFPLPVLIEADDIRALKPELEYVVRAAANPTLPTYSYRISYQGQEKQVAQGWQLDVRLGLNRYRVQGWYTADIGIGGIDCPLIALKDLKLHVLVGDAVWNPPGGAFDTNVLSNPTTLTNVENGFGFVGGGYRIAERLRPSRKAVEEACFVYVW